MKQLLPDRILIFRLKKKKNFLSGGKISAFCLFTIILFLSFLFGWCDGFAESLLPQNGAVFLKAGDENLTITPYADNIIRIALSKTITVENTDAVTLKPQPVTFSVDTTGAIIWIKTDSVTITVNDQTLGLQFYNPAGVLIASFDGFFSDSVYSGIRFNLTKDEMIFGGGEGAIPINRRGYRLNLNNEPHWGYGWGEENLNYSIPHFISSSDYAVYYDDGGIGYADIGKKDSSKLEIATEGVNRSFFFLLNSNQNALHKSFARLTGTQPMPPRWALGNLMSRFGYQTQQEATDKLDSMLAAGYPVDGIILDLYWFGQGSANWMMGDLDWYAPSWTSPQAMISNFKKKGVQTILITEPYILETSKNFKEADQKGFFATESTGKTNIIGDFFLVAPA